MEWKPIETAPKDGDKFVAANFDNSPNFIVVAWYSKTHNVFKYTGGDVIFTASLTHWMPLPSPPKDIES